MERAIIYCAKTGLEATDHFVPELLEKYCKDNGYEIVAMLSEPASTEGVSFPMKYAFIGLNMEEDVNTIITLSKDMIGEQMRPLLIHLENSANMISMWRILMENLKSVMR